MGGRKPQKILLWPPHKIPRRCYTLVLQKRRAQPSPPPSHNLSNNRIAIRLPSLCLYPFIEKFSHPSSPLSARSNELSFGRDCGSHPIIASYIHTSVLHTYLASILPTYLPSFSLTHSHKSAHQYGPRRCMVLWQAQPSRIFESSNYNCLLKFKKWVKHSARVQCHGSLYSTVI